MKSKKAKSCGSHEFTEEETRDVRSSLLTWFHKHGRVLPWRDISRIEENADARGYAVLVSEIMLQQTQVATVVDYYKKWLKKWPTTKELSRASLDDVNQVWSGLGYYSRGRRLWEAAKLIEDKMNGKMPQSSEELMKLPGVGRYTACAVASIAYGENVGVVDGNVLRVMSRIRTIGSEIDSASTVDWIWGLADNLVDPNCPGDFNQSVMELGATVCTPKNPLCNKCPIMANCQAKKAVPDIEESCDLCLKAKPDLTLGVQIFPKKTKKAASREETTLILALSTVKDGEKVFAVQQRPKTGLLANLWELLSLSLPGGVTEESSEERSLLEKFLEDKKILYDELKRQGVVNHIFSHIKMKYIVYSATAVGMDDGLKYLSGAEFLEMGTSTAMKKVMDFLADRGKKRKVDTPPKNPKQRSISSYFQTVNK